MGYQENAQYFERMAPYAIRASKALGIPTGVILAQWGNESAYGTSNLAVHHNNHAGITYVPGLSIAVGGTNGNSGFASYASLDQFVDDYIRVMSLSYYANVRSASTPENAFHALGESPYAESHYDAGGGPGSSLISIYDTYGLSGYNDDTEADHPAAGGGGGSLSDNIKNAVSGLSQSEMLKYAGVGLAIAAAFALLSEN